MQCAFWTFLCCSLNENRGEAVELIWPVAAPVGGPARLGTLCSSNWGISFFLSFFFTKERGLTLSFSLSLPSSPLNLVVSLLFIYKFSTSPFALSFSQNLLGRFVSCSLSTCSCSPSLFSLSLSDLSVGEWQQDSSSGNTSRVLSYTIALNNPLGPKTAPVVETQVSPWQTPTLFSFII